MSTITQPTVIEPHLRAGDAHAAAGRSRQLGLWMVTALVVGNMVGSGVFLLPASLGPFGGISLVGWGVSAAGSACLALVFARLGQRLPKSGGPYTYARAGFGDFAGFLVAWGYWISICVGTAALATAFVSYATVFVPALATVPALGAGAALASLWALTAVNLQGVRPAGVVQVWTVVLKLLPLVAIIAVGAFAFEPAHFRPFNPSGQGTLSAVSATVALTLWAFLGMESGTVPAEEVTDPARTIPRATLLGTAIATFVYVLGTVVVMGVIEPAALSTSTAPFADAARTLVGPWGAYVMGAGAAISCLGALNGWILISGQVPMAASRDRLLPSPLGRLSDRETPSNAILISTGVASVLVAMNYTRGLVGAFTFMIQLATVATLVPYVFSSLAALLIARDTPTPNDTGEPFGPRSTGGTAMTVIASLAFLYSLWAVAGSGRDAVFWGFLLLLAGLPLYVVMVRGRKAES